MRNWSDGNLIYLPIAKGFSAYRLNGGFEAAAVAVTTPDQRLIVCDIVKTEG